MTAWIKTADSAYLRKYASDPNRLTHKRLLAFEELVLRADKALYNQHINGERKVATLSAAYGASKPETTTQVLEREWRVICADAVRKAEALAIAQEAHREVQERLREWEWDMKRIGWKKPRVKKDSAPA